MFAKDQRPFMVFFSCFHAWHARKRADSSHGDEIPIGRIEVLTHAAVKTGVEEESLGVLWGNDEFRTKDGLGYCVGVRSLTNCGMVGKLVSQMQ